MSLDKYLDKTKVYIGFQSGTNFLARVIRFFTRSKYSHSFLLHYSKSWNGWLALGADQGGWIYTPAEKEENVDLYEVPVDLWAGLRACRGQLGAPYDVGGLLGMSVVEIALHWFKRKIKNPFLTRGAWFCSEILLQVLWVSGLRLAVVAGESDPQQVKDQLVLEPGVIPIASYGHWTCI